MPESGVTERQADRIIALLDRIESHLDSIKTETLDTRVNTSHMVDMLKEIGYSVGNIEAK